MAQDIFSDICGTTQPYFEDPNRNDVSENDQKSDDLDRFQIILMRLVFIIVYGILVQIVFILLFGILWIINSVLKSVKWAVSGSE